MKILYITTIASTMGFFKSIIKELIDNGNKVDLACNMDEGQIENCFLEWGCKIISLPCSRNPVTFGNIKVIAVIKKIVKKNGYDLVHCHTPIASACCRLACRELRKRGFKVVYTAHGFHFYTGAPLKNWLFYYTIEWILSFWTDILITINKEDYERAQKMLHAQKTLYVPGVGVDIQRFQRSEKGKVIIRKLFGIKEEEFLILSVGELNKNKNHETIIRTIAKLNDKRIHYFIIGQGGLKSHLQKLIRKLNLQKQIHILGYRNDIEQIYQCADLYILPSAREGLNVSIMEAMASGLPIVCSNIRGNRDLVIEGKGGFLCRTKKIDDYKKSIEMILNSKEDAKKMGAFNTTRVQRFGITRINKQMNNIYQKITMDKRV